MGLGDDLAYGSHSLIGKICLFPVDRNNFESIEMMKVMSKNPSLYQRIRVVEITNHSNCEEWVKFYKLEVCKNYYEAQQSNEVFEFPLNVVNDFGYIFSDEDAKLNLCPKICCVCQITEEEAGSLICCSNSFPSNIGLMNQSRSSSELMSCFRGFICPDCADNDEFICPDCEDQDPSFESVWGKNIKIPRNGIANNTIHCYDNPDSGDLVFY